MLTCCLQTATCWNKDCKSNRTQFRKLLNFSVKDTHFVFNGQLFDRIDGVAKGLPLGPSLANILMCTLEQRYLNECRSELKPVLYHRYVDDTFCLFRSRSAIEKFLDPINSYNPNIKFTVELEMDNALPFLDVSVTHDQNSFSTSLYRKKAFTGFYIDFGTLSSNKYKVNLIRFLVYRTFHICSTYADFYDEVVKVKGILLSKGPHLLAKKRSLLCSASPFYEGIVFRLKPSLQGSSNNVTLLSN